MTLLEIEDATLGYGEHVILRNLSMTVMPGEIVALLGRNGVGKTTTLNAISGLIPAQSGTIKVLGELVDTKRPFRNSRRGVAHVPEGRCLFRQMSVGENLRSTGMWKGRGSNRAFDMFPVLEELTSRKSGLLSGGEQQMLVIGRAMLLNPKLLLIDELSLGLAGMVARSIYSQLRKIAEELDLGVLLVEQFVHLALETADRAYVLGSGRIALEGTAADLRSRFDEVEAAYLGIEGAGVESALS